MRRRAGAVVLGPVDVERERRVGHDHRLEPAARASATVVSAGTPKRGTKPFSGASASALTPPSPAGASAMPARASASSDSGVTSGQSPMTTRRRRARVGKRRREGVGVARARVHEHIDAVAREARIGRDE